MPTEAFVAGRLCLKGMRLFSEVMILDMNEWTFLKNG
jgi:hypothetical protein